MTFKDFLEKNNISIKQAAEELNCSYEDIRRYSLGLIIPRPQRLLLISEWSNGEVTPNDFYTRENNEVCN